jgi:hypothetical protein
VSSAAIAGVGWILGFPAAVAARLLLLFPTMARHSTFAARFASFLAGPLVRGPLLVRGFATFAGDLALLGSIHRCKSTILFCHFPLRAHPRAAKHSGCNACATEFV